MSKEKTRPTDSADLLVQRQSRLLTHLIDGIQRGGLTDEEWLRVYIHERRHVDRGFLSNRSRQVMNCFLQYRLYTIPTRLVQLVKRLEEEFDLIQRLYTRKSMLNLSNEDGKQVVSTLQNPKPFNESITGGKNTGKN